jgi:hypothetical protein
MAHDDWHINWSCIINVWKISPYVGFWIVLLAIGNIVLLSHPSDNVDVPFMRTDSKHILPIFIGAHSTNSSFITSCVFVRDTASRWVVYSPPKMKNLPLDNQAYFAYLLIAGNTFSIYSLPSQASKVYMDVVLFNSFFSLMKLICVCGNVCLNTKGTSSL